MKATHSISPCILVRSRGGVLIVAVADMLTIRANMRKVELMEYSVDPLSGAFSLLIYTTCSCLHRPSLDRIQYKRSASDRHIHGEGSPWPLVVIDRQHSRSSISAQVSLLHGDFEVRSPPIIDMESEVGNR